MKGKRDPVAEFDALVLAAMREMDKHDEIEAGSWSVIALATKLPATETDVRESIHRLHAKGLQYVYGYGWRIKPKDAG